MGAKLSRRYSPLGSSDGEASKPHVDASHLDGVAIVQRLSVDGSTVQLRFVVALQVLDLELIPSRGVARRGRRRDRDETVLAAHRAVHDLNVTTGVPSNHDLLHRSGEDVA